MKLSEEGRKALIIREGSRRKAYLDTKGIPTIGVGHTGPEVRLGLVWTDNQVENAFIEDVKWAEAAVNAIQPAVPKQQQFDALVSFVFNVGATQFGRSTLRKKLQQGDYSGASAEFDKWHIPVSIIGRRNSEKIQFNS